MHEEAQETARRLAEEALSQDVRQHRQGLWHEQRLHRSSMEQECSIRYMHARSHQVTNDLIRLNAIHPHPLHPIHRNQALSASYAEPPNPPSTNCTPPHTASPTMRRR